MKIIHTSDLHLNSKIEKLSAKKATIRREEVIRTFERMVEYAVDNLVSVIIIAGDMFDTTKIPLKVFDRIMHLINSNENIDFLYLPGNHEQDSFLSLIEEMPKNLKTFGDEWSYYQYGNVVIGGVTVNNSNVKVIYDKLSLNSNNFNIITLHGQVAGYKNNDNVEIISIPLLKDKNVDYLALGHFHSFAEGNIDGRGKYAYSGCPEGRGFDETGVKGFILIDTESVDKYKFIDFSYRQLFQVEYSVDNETSWFDFKERIYNEIKSTIDSKNLVKLVLTGEHQLSFEKDLVAFDMLLNDYFFYAKIVDETKVNVELSDFENDKSFRGEFVREVLNSDLSDLDKQAVILKGLKALRGELE